MATIQNLMAFGVASPLARRLGQNPVIASAVGASQASATTIGGTQYLTLVTSGTSSLSMPKVGGQVSATAGALIGDEFWITNITAASVAIYAANNDAGSAVTFYGNGVSVAGATGVSVALGQSIMLKPITSSTWVYLKSSV